MRFDSEFWRAELGDQAAKCLKGENGPSAKSIVSGRAFRALREVRSEEFRRRFGKKLPWSKEGNQ